MDGGEEVKEEVDRAGGQAAGNDSHGCDGVAYYGAAEDFSRVCLGFSLLLKMKDGGASVVKLF